MEEKTKELKTIEELEEDKEELSHTIKLDKISEEEIIKSEEETEKTEAIEEKTEIEQLEDNEPPKEKTPEKGNKKSKKKIFIIIGIVLILLITIIVSILLLSKPKKEEKPIKNDIETNDYSEYGNVIYKSLKNGKLDKIIKEELERYKINTKTVTLLNIDIDSDNRQDLIVFASDNNNKCILNLNVKDDINYEKGYKIDSKDSIGYLFSRDDEKYYWYIDYNKKIYPIDGHSNYIDIESEDYMFKYDLITQKYKNKNIMEYGLKYNFDKKLDIDELEELQITNKEMLIDNNTSIDAQKKKLEDKENEYYQKKQEENIRKEKEAEEKFLKEFSKETLEKVLLVAVTNYFAEDTKDENGNYDISKFHDSSYDGEYKMTIKDIEKCEISQTYNSRMWSCKNVIVKSSKDGYTITNTMVKKIESNYVIETITLVNSMEKFLDIDGRNTGVDSYPFLKVSSDLIK